MKIKWNRLITADKKRLRFGGFLFCLLAVAMLIIRLAQPTIHSKSDLYFIRGAFDEYHFSKGGRSSYYAFSLRHCNSAFQIKADFLSLFDETKFRDLSCCDSITIAISKSDKYRLCNSPKWTLFVYSIENSETVFLDVNDTIRRHNSSLGFYLCAMLFLFGLSFFYISEKVVK